MDLATQIISNDKIVKNDTMADLKEFNSQPLATQPKKREQLVSMMPAIKKFSPLLGDDIIEISFENDALNDKIDFYDEKWLGESKTKLLKKIDHDIRAKLIMSRLKKQMEKHSKMAYISFNKLRENEFDNIVSRRDKLQDMNINQLELEVHAS